MKDCFVTGQLPSPRCFSGIHPGIRVKERMRFSGDETKLTLIQLRMHFAVKWLADVMKPHGNEAFPSAWDHSC